MQVSSTSDEIERPIDALDAKFEKAARLGKPHLSRLAPGIRAMALPPGSYVVVDVETGAFVTGPSRREARLAFRAQHPTALAWASPVEDLPLAYNDGVGR